MQGYLELVESISLEGISTEFKEEMTIIRKIRDQLKRTEYGKE